VPLKIDFAAVGKVILQFNFHSQRLFISTASYNISLFSYIMENHSSKYLLGIQVFVISPWQHLSKQ